MMEFFTFERFFLSLKAIILMLTTSGSTLRFPFTSVLGVVFISGTDTSILLKVISDPDAHNHMFVLRFIKSGSVLLPVLMTFLRVFPFG